MKVPRLGVILVLQLPAYTTATTTSDLSCICHLYHSSWQHWILDPLSKASDRTCNPMVPSQICFCCAMMGTPDSLIFLRLGKGKLTFIKGWNLFKDARNGWGLTIILRKNNQVYSCSYITDYFTRQGMHAWIYFLILNMQNIQRLLWVDVMAEIFTVLCWQ